MTILDIFFKNNVVGIVHKISTLHIHIRGTDGLQSSHYGYCKSYCRIDYVIPYAVVRGMVTPPDEIEFTNTISGCTVYFRYITLMFGVEFFR